MMGKDGDEEGNPAGMPRGGKYASLFALQEQSYIKIMTFANRYDDIC